MPVVYTARAEAELSRLSQERQARIRTAVATAVRRRSRRKRRRPSSAGPSLRLAVAGVRVYGYWWLSDTLVVVSVQPDPEAGA